MTNESRPSVAVVGGFYDLDADANLGQEARKYAESIGGELAKAGFSIVVYFSDDKSLEPHVVRGFVTALPASETRQRIDVRYSEAQRGKVSFVEQVTRTSIFREYAFPGLNWEAPFYRSLAERDSVDAVLLMAGGQSTLNAGHVAVGRGLPVLAIDKYSGSAQIFRTELATRISGYPSSQNSTPHQLVSWLHEQHRLEAERRRLERIRELEYERMKSHGRFLIWLFLTLIALLAALGFGLLFVDNPRSFIFSMGSALASAGAVGALTRGLTVTNIKIEPRLATLLGAAAGLMVGLAYLIPQLITGSQLLEQNASTIRAADKIQLLSVVLVAFTAGIGFDVVFRRLLQEADKVPVGLAR